MPGGIPTRYCRSLGAVCSLAGTSRQDVFTRFAILPLGIVVFLCRSTSGIQWHTLRGHVHQITDSATCCHINDADVYRDSCHPRRSCLPAAGLASERAQAVAKWACSSWRLTVPGCAESAGMGRIHYEQGCDAKILSTLLNTNAGNSAKGLPDRGIPACGPFLS